MAGVELQVKTLCFSEKFTCFQFDAADESKELTFSVTFADTLPLLSALKNKRKIVRKNGDLF